MVMVIILRMVKMVIFHSKLKETEVYFSEYRLGVCYGGAGGGCLLWGGEGGFTLAKIASSPSKG